MLFPPFFLNNTGYLLTKNWHKKGIDTFVKSIIMKKVLMFLLACSFIFPAVAQDFGGKNSNKGHKSSGGHHKGKKHTKPKKAK